MHKFLVNECFESIQGEGDRAGMRAFFVRFHLCNLKCVWCDTKYTWNMTSDSHTEYTESELRELIESSETNTVIFTGGEPALYRLDLLDVLGNAVYVETNATIIPTKSLNIKLPDGTEISREPMQKMVVDRYNWIVSPKISNSKQTFNPECMKYWAGKRNCIFKFVCCNYEDIEEVERVAEEFNLHKKKIYIGLEGVTAESQLRSDMVDKIIEKGFNFSPRLHVLLWNRKRKK